MSVSESNNNIRIRTTPLGSDKYVKININQKFDFLEILSLRIGQEQVYRKYCSDYGVIAGRVVCNKGVGVPNAKISVFIPISEEDQENPTIRQIYPYTKTDDLGLDGLKYNLLTQAPLVDDICHTAVGSFPLKRRVLDCEPWCEVYGKYYKYSTSTNASGDYLIFGVPTGVQIVHMDVDLSDIGYLSQKPYDMISQGSSIDQFESYNKFASAPNLGQLPQVKTQNKTINVLPFWGDLDECQIGINRVDFDLNYDIQTTAFFIGSIFGDSEKNSVNKNCRPRKKLGNMDQLITGPGTIEMIRKTPFGGLESYALNGNQNIDDDGTWILQLPMNLNHKVTDEFGNLIESGNPTVGIATKGYYRFRIGMNDYLKGFARVRSRAKFLVPNYGDYTFDDTITDFTSTGKPNFADLEWNGIYTVKQFISRYSSKLETKCKDLNFIGIKDVFENGNNNPFPFNRYDRNGNPLFVILCYILAFILLPIILILNLLISFINVLPDWLVGDGVNCAGIECNGVTYAPGCLSPKDGQTVSDNVPDYVNCVQATLADAFNVYSFYFTNDWINGTLYAFLFKYKYVRNGRSKFCDAEKDTSNDKYVRDQICVADNTIAGQVFPQCIGVFKTNKGLIVENDYELYYAATIDGYFLFATDVYNLGSSKVCDYFGKPKIITEIPTTTFNYLETTQLDSTIPGDDVGIEPWLAKINCNGVQQDPGQCINTSRICELDVNPEYGDTDPISTDSLEIEAMEVRADLECLNSNQCALDPNNGDGAFGIDWAIYRGTPRFNEASRNIYQGSNQITNSFFFYFGLLPGKSAIDKLTSKYFSPCERKEPCPIVINANITNNVCPSGNTASITALPEGGTPPYKYNWFRGTYGNSMTPICVEFVFEPSPITLPVPTPGTTCSDTISSLYSDYYTVVVKDNVGQICKKTFKVEDPIPFQVLFNYSQYICPDANNGFIEVQPIGGTPPYNIDWSYGADISAFNTANTNGSFYLTGLGPTSNCTNSGTNVGSGSNAQGLSFIADFTNSLSFIVIDNTNILNKFITNVQYNNVQVNGTNLVNSNININGQPVPTSTYYASLDGDYTFDVSLYGNYEQNEFPNNTNTSLRVSLYLRQYRGSLNNLISSNVMGSVFLGSTDIAGSIAFVDTTTLTMTSNDFVRLELVYTTAGIPLNSAVNVDVGFNFTSGQFDSLTQVIPNSGGGNSNTQYYVAIVSDSALQYGCQNVATLTVDITQSCGFSVTGTSLGPCSATTATGSATWGPTGGFVPPITYILENTDLSYYWSGTSYVEYYTKSGLQGGSSCTNPIIYTATCIDSCGFSASTIIGMVERSLKYFPDPNNSSVNYYTTEGNCNSNGWNHKSWLYWTLIEGKSPSYNFNNGCKQNLSDGNGGFYASVTSSSGVESKGGFWYLIPPLNGNTSRYINIEENRGQSCNLGLHITRSYFSPTEDDVTITVNANNPSSPYSYGAGTHRICKTNDLILHAMLGFTYSDIANNSCSYKITADGCQGTLGGSVNP